MTAVELWETYRPKIAEARDRDRREMQSSLVSIPVLVGKDWLEPLTLRRLMYLEAINHPMLTGASCPRAGVIDFLWVMSARFKPGDDPGLAKFRRRFWFRKIDGEKLREYLAGEFPNEPDANGRPPAPAWVAQLVDMIASEYGWSEADILDAPIKRLMQYTEALVARKGDKQPTPKSPRADRIKSEYLREVADLTKSTPPE